MLFLKSILTPNKVEGWGKHVEQELAQHKTKYISQGTLFIVAGVLAAAFPATTALNVELIIGAILLLTGVFQLVMTFKSKMHAWSFASACSSMAIGALILARPLDVLLAFVTLLAIFMTLEGGLELLLALHFRPARNWSWMLFSGLTTIALAAMLWIGFPAFDVLYLGWVVAINLIFYGLSLLMLVWRSDAE